MAGGSSTGGTLLGFRAQAGRPSRGPRASGACGERRAGGGRGLRSDGGPSAARPFACICLPVSPVPSERAVPWTVLTAPS